MTLALARVVKPPHVRYKMTYKVQHAKYTKLV